MFVDDGGDFFGVEEDIVEVDGLLGLWLRCWSEVVDDVDDRRRLGRLPSAAAPVAHEPIVAWIDDREVPRQRCWAGYEKVPFQTLQSRPLVRVKTTMNVLNSHALTRQHTSLTW